MQIKSSDNTLRGLNNSSYHTKAESSNWFLLFTTDNLGPVMRKGTI